MRNVLTQTRNSLEVRLGVVPRLDEPVPDGQGGRLVALEVVKRHPAACKRVLHVGHDALLDAQNIVLLVRVWAEAVQGVSQSYFTWNQGLGQRFRVLGLCVGASPGGEVR